MPETLFSDAPTAAKVPPVDEPIMIIFSPICLPTSKASDKSKIQSFAATRPSASPPHPWPAKRALYILALSFCAIALGNGANSNLEAEKPCKKMIENFVFSPFLFAQMTSFLAQGCTPATLLSCTSKY